MLKDFANEFKKAPVLEKFNTLASVFTISGVSLLTIINALGGVNFAQLFVSLIVFGFIFMLVSILIGISLWFTDYLKPLVNPIILLLNITGMVLVFLGFLVLLVFSGIDFIKSFGDY